MTHRERGEPTHEEAPVSHHRGKSMASVPEVYRESFRFRPDPRKATSPCKKRMRYLFCILTFISFLLLLVGTPLDIYRSRTNNTCVTLWGSRSSCGRNEYTPTDWVCDDRQSRINAARAFAILSILISFASFMLGVLLVLEILVERRIIPAVMSLGATMTEVLTWACVAGVYHDKLCGNDNINVSSAMKDTHTLGAAFGLVVASFCVQCIATVVEFFG